MQYLTLCFSKAKLHNARHYGANIVVSCIAHFSAILHSCVIDRHRRIITKQLCKNETTVSSTVFYLWQPHNLLPTLRLQTTRAAKQNHPQDNFSCHEYQPMAKKFSNTRFSAIVKTSRLANSQNPIKYPNLTLIKFYKLFLQFTVAKICFHNFCFITIGIR